MMVISIHVPYLPSTYYHREDEKKNEKEHGNDDFDVGRNVFRNGI